MGGSLFYIVYEKFVKHYMQYLTLNDFERKNGIMFNFKNESLSALISIWNDC